MLLQYYSVLQSTTPVLLCTTQYYSSTTLYYTVLLQYYSVLQSTTPVLLCTTKYYSSTTLYYKVLLHYYFVLHSATPVLLCTTKYYSSTTLYYKVLLQYYSVLQSSTPVLLCTTQYYSSTTLYYTILLQYYSVLQSTTPVLLCTTKYYSSTTLYYTVLLQYYSVLQSTTPVLLCTTKYYSSTTLYYKVLLHYYFVLHSATPVLLCTTKYYSSTTLYYKVLLQYYSVLQSTTPVLLCTTQYYSSTTLYYTILLQYYSVLQSTTPVLLCTTKYYSSTSLYYKVLLQYYSVLQSTTPVLLQYYSVLLMIDPRSSRDVSTTSPNTAPATQNDSPKFQQNFSKTDETSVPMRDRSEQDPTTKPSVRNPPRNRGYFSRPPRAFCIEKYNISRSGYHSKFHRILRLPRKVTLQLHQILRLPRKMTLMINPRHTWNAIYNARRNKCHCPNSPNTAPATKNESHDWSLSHMKRYLQCAEQQVSLSKLTKYCACHEKRISWLILVTHETLFTMRGTTGGILQHHQILRLPRKMTVMTDPRHIWNAIYNARNNRSHPGTSPNTAPATQNDSPTFQRNFSKTDETSFPMRGRSETIPRMIREWSELDPTMKPSSATRLATEVTFRARHEHFLLKNTTFRAPAIIPNFTEYCACHEKWQFNITKYCACHAKWLSWLILVTYEMSLTMRGTTSVILQHHRILRLPRKMTVITDPRHMWNVISNARNNRCHPGTSANTAPATQNDSPTFQRNFSKTAETSFPMRGRSENDPRMIREWSEHETVTPQPASQPRLLFTPATSILYWKIQHFALRLSFQISPNTAPATKSDTSTSPNTAPATQNDSHDQSATHMCTCHEKSHYATLLFSSIRYYSLTNLFSNESNLLRI